MYNNILVPLVFSHEDSAKKAIAIAHQLLSEGGKVTLLHVVEQIPSYAATMMPKDVFENSITDARAALQAVADKYCKDADVTVITGHSSRAILDHSDTIGAKCVVISSHQPGLEDFFLGSTAARVVRHARCAVHVLR